MSHSPTLKIRNWDRWQSYRRDRGQPPWIKVHRNLMRNPEWVELTDAQRGQLVSIWLLAADSDGQIPSDPKMIQRLCYMDKQPNLKVLTEQGFIEPDATLASQWRQHDALETEAETEGDDGSNDPLSGRNPTTRVREKKNGHASDAVDILNFLNERCGKQYRPVDTNLALIRARLDSGASPTQCRQVIAMRRREWLGTEMEKYLRPATLFNKVKFEQYVGELGVPG